MQTIHTLAVSTDPLELLPERERPFYLNAIWDLYFAETTPGTRILDDYLAIILELHFSDVPRPNVIDIRYSYPWKYQLGCICRERRTNHSLVEINALLQHIHVPEYVLLTTIAHELAHYTHGFGSSLPRRYRHPHAGNVVDRELEQRELTKELQASEMWLGQAWFPFYTVARLSGWRGMALGRIPHQRRVLISEPCEAAVAALLPKRSVL